MPRGYRQRSSVGRASNLGSRDAGSIPAVATGELVSPESRVVPGLVLKGIARLYVATCSPFVVGTTRALALDTVVAGILGSANHLSRFHWQNWGNRVQRWERGSLDGNDPSKRTRVGQTLQKGDMAAELTHAAALPQLPRLRKRRVVSLSLPNPARGNACGCHGQHGAGISRRRLMSPSMRLTPAIRADDHFVTPSEQLLSSATLHMPCNCRLPTRRRRRHL